MVSNSIDVLVDALKETHLLRSDQFSQLVNEIATKIEDPQDLARHLVKMGWITLYQAKKLLNGRGAELVIGSYVIQDKLGEGGMGKVYKAKQLRLNRSVALKVVRPDLLANELAMKRFQREAKAVAQLSHPNMVRLYDADQVGDRHFLAMEFIEGNDLSVLVNEQGPLPIGMACSFIRQAAAGLEHAHDHGLVHRDIKPSNLLVSAPGKIGKIEAGGIIKILDMGLARLGTCEEGEFATALTQDGTVIGTPDYMSPEQAKNSSLVDARSDLYSLGCTFYFLLTGKPPYPEGTTLEKLLQHQIDPPKSIKKLRRDIPDGLAAVIHKLLAKNPDERYQSGSELAKALEPWSVFDATSELLKTSGKMSQVTACDNALPVPCTPIAADVNPFHFEEAEEKEKAKKAEPLPSPKKAEEPAAPAEKKPILPPKPATADKPKTPPARQVPKKQRGRKWIIGIAVALTLVVGGALAALWMMNKPAAEDDEASREQMARNELLLPPAENKTLDYYLPRDTEVVAVLNMNHLNESRTFADALLPQFKDFTALLKKGGGVDPFKAVERVIVAVPATNSAHAVIIIQGNGLGSAGFLNWVGKLPKVSITQEQIGGPNGSTRDVYRMPGKKHSDGTGQEILYGAVISNASAASALVLSASKERVLETLARTGKAAPVAFNDPSIRTVLSRYPRKSSEKQSTLWIGVGGHSKMFEPFAQKSTEPGDTSISCLTASFRLTEALMFELDIDAKTKALATEAKDGITNFFVLASLANKDDARFARIADLLQNAQPTPRKKDAPNTNVHQWWRSISSDKVAEWFTPFFEGSLTN